MGMTKKTGPSNAHLKALIIEIKKNAKAKKSNLWNDVAEKLSRSRRQRVEVNVANIERHAKDGDTIVVPGKVLGTGILNKKVTVAAWRFSPSAETKIKAKGNILTIQELMKKSPKGSNVRIMV